MASGHSKHTCRPDRHRCFYAWNTITSLISTVYPFCVFTKSLIFEIKRISLKVVSQNIIQMTVTLCKFPENVEKTTKNFSLSWVLVEMALYFTCTGDSRHIPVYVYNMAD